MDYSIVNQHVQYASAVAAAVVCTMEFEIRRGLRRSGYKIYRKEICTCISTKNSKSWNALSVCETIITYAYI